jgi:cyclopropane fatty-acyl-phospholipid synthase-like methyltransferase
LPIDQQSFSAIAHGQMPNMNPLPETILAEAVERLALRPGAPVLDLGCGKGTFLARVVERWAADGIGVELSPVMAAEARRRAREVRGGRMTVIEGDALTFAASRSFDAVISLGPGWEHGTLGDLLETLVSHLGSSGTILAADLYWRSPPSPEYLAMLGMDPNEMRTHTSNRQSGQTLGLRLRWSRTTPSRDFARYQRLYRDTAMSWAANHPDDPDAPSVQERAERSWTRYRSGGRLYFGFAIYQFARG